MFPELTFKLEDNFFELGGNSLLATQVVARLSAIIALEIPLIALFEDPTIRGLHRALDRLLGEPADGWLERLAEDQ